jgi:hypothetical protein
MKKYKKSLLRVCFLKQINIGVKSPELYGKKNNNFITISDLKENFTGKKAFKKDNPEKLFCRQKIPSPKEKAVFWA